MHVFAVYGNFLFPFGLVTHGMITQFQVAQRICNQMLHTLLPFICVVCITVKKGSKLKMIVGCIFIII